jgi:hypothetical protein
MATYIQTIIIKKNYSIPINFSKKIIIITTITESIIITIIKYPTHQYTFNLIN